MDVPAAYRRRPRPTPRLPQHAAALLVAWLSLLSAQSHADVTTASNGLLTPFAPIVASARVRFAVTLGSYVSLRVGSIGSTVNTASIDLTALTTGCTVAPCQMGNGTPVNASYDGGFGAAGLPVMVRSNAGAVAIAASVVSALASGSQSVPFSQIVATSSDSAHLAAPTIPDTGSGPSVTVAETSPGSRLTDRSASWQFKYANSVVPIAGTYQGQVIFTATTP